MFIGFAERVGGGTGATQPTQASGGPGRADPTGTVLVTMRGYVRAIRTLHSVGGPTHYREVGRFQVAWRIPAGRLIAGHTFRSISATVKGTTSAISDGAPGESCRGRLRQTQAVPAPDPGQPG